ncbi:MAG: DUF4160 domain-containing protein [Anaerolineae bacterium]|nr:DUF4160 domain-containing protein [Anaerolineae bacterium]
MPKVHEEAGCKFFIYVNDHAPAHVHVYVGDGALQIYLDNHATVKQQWHVNVLEVKKAQRLTLANQGKLLKAWVSLHGKSE